MTVRKLDRIYMQESLRCFTDEQLPDEGFDKPDVFIILAAQGNNLTFLSSSNSHKKTLATLKRAVMLHKESKLEADNG